MVVDKLDTTFAALSDPTRRAMIERLSHGPASVHGLTEPFALSQQMISKHIAYLVRARMVIKTKRGRESVCTLRPEAIKTVSDWAISYRRFWEESFDKLDVVVNQMKKTGVRDDKKTWKEQSGSLCSRTRLHGNELWLRSRHGQEGRDLADSSGSRTRRDILRYC